MFYVLEIELREIGTIKVLNGGKPFEFLESAQIFCNEIYSENSKDMFDYYEFIILRKKDIGEFIISLSSSLI